MKNFLKSIESNENFTEIVDFVEEKENGITEFLGIVNQPIETEVIETLNETVCFGNPSDSSIEYFNCRSGKCSIKLSKNEYAVFASKSHDPGLCGDLLWLSS